MANKYIKFWVLWCKQYCISYSFFLGRVWQAKTLFN